MTAQNIETYMIPSGFAEIDSVLIAAGAGDQDSSAVDLQDVQGCLFIVEVTDINTTGTLQLTVIDSATSGGTYAVATDSDGNNAATAAAAITADGIYFVRVNSDNVEQFVKIRGTVATAGIDYHVYAMPYGPQYRAKPGVAEGTALNFQILLD